MEATTGQHNQKPPSGRTPGTKQSVKLEKMVQLYGGSGGARTMKPVSNATAVEKFSATFNAVGKEIAAARDDKNATAVEVDEGESALSREETPLLPELTQTRSLMSNSIASESSNAAAKKREQVRKRVNGSKVRFADNVEKLDRKGPQVAGAHVETSDSEECRDDDMDCSSSSEVNDDNVSI